MNEDDLDLVPIPRGMLDTVLDATICALLLLVFGPLMGLLTFALLWLITGG